MNLTNGEIFKAKRVLNPLMGNKLPVKTSYGLAKLSVKLNDQFLVIDTVRRGLCQTYGTPDPKDAKAFNVLPEIEGKANPKYGKFIEEIEELMSKTVEIVIDVVTLPDTLEVEPATLLALEKFIKV